jgi:hypothetical protein
MARSHESEVRNAAALILAEAIEKREVGQIAACPTAGPAQSAVQLARTRASLGMSEVFHLILDKVHETSGHGSGSTRH